MKLRDWLWVLLIPLAASAAAGVWVGRFGPGLSGDSFTYTSMSKHIAAGKGAAYFNNTTGGKSLPMTWFAPLWPAVLSPLHHAGIPFRHAALALLIAIFFTNLLLSGLIARGVTGSIWAGICLQLVFLADANWLTWHFYLLTEALFFLQINLALFCLWRYSQSKNGMWWWLLAANAALFSLNRYIGAVLIPGFLLALWIAERFSKKSLLRVTGTGAIMFLPFAAWLYRNYRVSGMGYDKSLPGVDTSRYFPLELAGSVLGNGLSYISRMIQTSGGAAWTGWMAAGVFVAAFVWVCTKWARGRAAWPLSILGIAVVYAIGLWAAMGWRHMSAMSDEVRYFTPFFLLLWTAVVTGAFADQDGRRASAAGIPAFVGGTVPCAAACLLAAGCVTQFVLWGLRVSAAGADGSAGQGWAFISTIRWFP
jgi:hypothetical protein